MTGDKIAESAFPSAAEAPRGAERGSSRAGAESGDSEGSESSEGLEIWRGDVVVIL